MRPRPFIIVCNSWRIDIHIPPSIRVDVVYYFITIFIQMATNSVPAMINTVDWCFL
jgi:hypothetical protein